jgi:hypothetical protein
MKRAALLGLITTTAFACGGRTMLADLPTDASVAPDGGTSKDGGVIGQDGGVIVFDGGVPMPDASPPPIDAGPPPGIIQCGTSVCNGSTETCCVTYNGQTLNETCTPQGQCQGASFDCSGASSCPPGEVCCGSFSQTSQGAQCVSTCQGGWQHPQICETDTECPQGETCRSSPFGFKVCRP